MFLALRELVFARTRFLLMGGVVALVAVLVVLLSGLSAGLVNDGVSGLERTPVTDFAFAEGTGTDAAFTRSVIETDQVGTMAEQPGVLEAAPYGLLLANAHQEDGSPVDLTLVGVEPGSFVAPAAIAEGDAVGAEDGCVVAATAGLAGLARGATQGAAVLVVVREPDFAAGFAELWASEPLEDWKLWMVYHLVTARAPYLSDDLVEANFDFYGRTLSGAQEVRERWKRAVSVVEGALGEAVGAQYVARHFPPAHKARMEELVATLVAAYRESITTLDWMTDETKEKALAKLDAFTPKIGYPVRWRDYSALVVDAHDLVGNVRRAHAFEQDRELGKIGRPLDRDEWFMTPQTVNAYYNPGMNEIVFPAAILQPPFFDPEADDAVNYGGIGAVIGHEIGHGFDDQGSKYDGAGRLEDWWTARDREEFEKRTTALVAQYDAYRPAQLGEDGPHVNGALTIGENIGDLGGLSIALKAYRIALGRPLDEAPVVDGLTGIERVFLGWAQVWQSKGRDEEVVRRIATDPHSPNEFRCNGVVRNVDEFYDAYDVQPGDALYLAPEERVRIW